MALAEFNLIKQYFTRPAQHRSTQLSVGDDCALLAVPEGYHLAITTDTMVEGVHFFPDIDPEQLAYKLVAVNLSDLASMGAEPVAITLALTMPKVDADWLHAFATGLFSLADKHGIDLIGGDTTSGPLTLSIQAMGLTPQHQALKRTAAKVGDLIFVTGHIGDAGLGLKIKQGYRGDNDSIALQRFNMPEPRIQEGLLLRSLANACIDISDGLAADLGHILTGSRVGAVLDYHKLPLSKPVRDYIAGTGDWQMPLVAGDDYELCFTVAAEHVEKLEIPCTCIGEIVEQAGLNIMRNGEPAVLKNSGFEHFYE